jgi:hypothetical protein
MLRQYFMALKVIGRWKHWEPYLDQHWGNIVSNVRKVHPVMDPKPPSPVTEKSHPLGRGWDSWMAKIQERRASALPLDEHAEGNDDANTVEDDLQKAEKELGIMRRVFGKWSRLAGIHGNACDTLKDDEFDVSWTKAIAPRVEGRIEMVSKDGST